MITPFKIKHIIPFIILIISASLFLPQIHIPFLSAANIELRSSIIFPDDQAEPAIAKIDPARGVSLAWQPPPDAITFTIEKQGELVATDFIRGKFGFFHDSDAFSGPNYNQTIQFTINSQDAGRNTISTHAVSTGVFDLDSILNQAQGGKCPNSSGSGFSFSGRAGDCHLQLETGVFELQHQLNFFRQRDGLDGFLSADTGLHGLTISGRGLAKTRIRPRQTFGDECKQQIQGDLTAAQDNLPVTCLSFEDDRLAQFSFASGGFHHLTLEAPDLPFGIVIFDPFSKNLTPDSQVEISSIALAGTKGVGISDATGLRMHLFTSTGADGLPEPDPETLQILQQDRLQITDSVISGFETGFDLSGGSPSLLGNVLQNETDLFLQTQGLQNTSDWQSDFFDRNWVTADGQVDFIFSDPSPDKFHLIDLRVLDLIPKSNSQTSFHFIPTAFAALSDDPPLIRSLLQIIDSQSPSLDSNPPPDSSPSSSGNDAFFASCKTPSSSDFLSALTLFGPIPSNTIDVVADRLFIEMRDNFKACVQAEVAKPDPTSEIRTSVLHILDEFWKLLEGYPVQNPKPDEERFVPDVCQQILSASNLSDFNLSQSSGLTPIVWITQFSSSCSVRLSKELDFAQSFVQSTLDIDNQDEMFRTLNSRFGSLINWMSLAQELLEDIIRNLTKLMKQWDPLPKLK